MSLYLYFKSSICNIIKWLNGTTIEWNIFQTRKHSYIWVNISRSDVFFQQWFIYYEAGESLSVHFSAWLGLNKSLDAIKELKCHDLHPSPGRGDRDSQIVYWRSTVWSLPHKLWLPLLSCVVHLCHVSSSAAKLLPRPSLPICRGKCPSCKCRYCISQFPVGGKKYYYLEHYSGSTHFSYTDPGSATFYPNWQLLMSSNN